MIVFAKVYNVQMSIARSAEYESLVEILALSRSV